MQLLNSYGKRELKALRMSIHLHIHSTWKFPYCYHELHEDAIHDFMSFQLLTYLVLIHRN